MLLLEVIIILEITVLELKTLLLEDIFENFRNKYIEIYELDPAHFQPAPGLASKTEIKLE